jgi:hypothetical protein
MNRLSPCLTVFEMIKLWGYYKRIFKLSYSTVNHVLKSTIVNLPKKGQSTILNKFRLDFIQVYLILLLYYNKTQTILSRIFVTIDGVWIDEWIY